jgi:hypothetical protein
LKIAPVNGLRFFGHRIPKSWHEQIFVAHLFTHPDYVKPISDLRELPLEPEARTLIRARVKEAFRFSRQKS